MNVSTRLVRKNLEVRFQGRGKELDMGGSQLLIEAMGVVYRLDPRERPAEREEGLSMWGSPTAKDAPRRWQCSELIRGRARADSRRGCSQGRCGDEEVETSLEEQYGKLQS